MSMHAFQKDILRTIRHEHRRFAAIMIITALGVMMFSGLRASCEDLRHEADDFYRTYHLHDLEILSTMGLNDADIEALESTKDIDQTEGVYEESVSVSYKDTNTAADIRTLSENIDIPYITDGSLPSNDQEVLVTSAFMNQTGLKTGDTFQIQENDDQNAFEDVTYKISGICTDVRDVNNPNGSMSYRSSGNPVIFIPAGAVHSDVYTSAVIRVSDASDLYCFEDVYKNRIKKVKNNIEKEIAPEEEKRRYDEICQEAYDEIHDKEEETVKQLETGYLSFLPAQQAHEKAAADAETMFSDAYDQLKNIRPVTWYVQDRSSLSSYVNVQSDADSIQEIGTVFPVVFLIVAVLISLTAITRMIEEERTCIGTYKSLGYTDAEISRKYIIYALSASLSGALIGTVMGFIVLPLFIFYVFHTMYLLPSYSFCFLPSYGIGGPFIFLLAVTTAAWYVCHVSLKETPASLMRPRAPRAGRRVLLERMTGLWSHMSFLNKVTARNVFRYKKRMFMTICGIAGCMALLLFGFSIRDSVHALIPEQYEEIMHYDILTVTNSSDFQSVYDKVKDDSRTDTVQPVMMSQVSLKKDNKEESLQLIVFPDNADVSKYISLMDLSGNNLSLRDHEVYVTRNAAQSLDLNAGERVSLQLPDLQEKDMKVNNLCENYLGNYVYMTENTYSQYFDEYAENAMLINADKNVKTKKWGSSIEKTDGVLSVSVTEKLKKEFESSFQLINAVVLIVILMSAALAAVVLYTLATTNISEREREIATLKVLGFYDNEVHSFINKESMILTGIGIILGIPAGYLFSRTLGIILKLPSIYLAPVLNPISYVICAALCAVFAIAMQLVTNRIMDQIDPATALKSVE